MIRFAYTVAGDVSEQELAELVDYHEQELAGRFAFERECRRRSSRKRGPLDCSHVIDAGEPYRYQVWKVPGTAGVEQRLDCEPCSRRDLRGWDR